MFDFDTPVSNTRPEKNHKRLRRGRGDQVCDEARRQNRERSDREEKERNHAKQQKSKFEDNCESFVIGKKLMMDEKTMRGFDEIRTPRKKEKRFNKTSSTRYAQSPGPIERILEERNNPTPVQSPFSLTSTPARKKAQAESPSKMNHEQKQQRTQRNSLYDGYSKTIFNGGSLQSKRVKNLNEMKREKPKPSKEIVTIDDDDDDDDDDIKDDQKLDEYRNSPLKLDKDRKSPAKTTTRASPKKNGKGSLFPTPDGSPSVETRGYNETVIDCTSGDETEQVESVTTTPTKHMPATVDLSRRTSGHSSNDGSTSSKNSVGGALCFNKLSVQDNPSQNELLTQPSIQSQPKKEKSRDYSTSTPDKYDIGQQQQSKSSTPSSGGSRMANMKNLVKGTLRFGIQKVNGTRKKTKKRQVITPGFSLGIQRDVLQSDDIESFPSPEASPGHNSKERKRQTRIHDHVQHTQTSSDYGASSLTQPIPRKKRRTYGNDKYCDQGQSQLGDLIPSFLSKSKDFDDDYVPPGSCNSRNLRSNHNFRTRKKSKSEVITIDESSEEVEEEDLAFPMVVDVDDPIVQVKMNSAADELEKEGMKKLGDRLTLDVVQIAIGDKVFSVGCKMSFRTGGPKPFIGLHYGKGLSDSSSVSTDDEEEPMHIIHLGDESITEMKYFLVNDDEVDNSQNIDYSPNHSIVGKQTTLQKPMMDVVDFDKTILNENPISFIAMKVMPNRENKLIEFAHTPDQSQLETDNNVVTSSSVESLLIVGELRSDEEFTTKRVALKEKNNTLGNLLQDAKLCSKETVMYTEALKRCAEETKREILASSKKKKKKRRNLRLGSDFCDARDDIVLVFPFPLRDDLMEEAARGLIEASSDFHVDGGNNAKDDENSNGLGENHDGTTKPNEEDQAPGTDSKYSILTSESSSRTHYLTIRLEDRDRLEPGEFLNDTLIDFWMRWIWRKEEPSSSKVHFFTSHFMSTLIEDGVDAVSRWTKKKSIDIFSKTLIFFPINESLHWSLCVVVNPGHIENAYIEDGDNLDLLPCILFMDSLKAHRKKKYASKLHEWLNLEWDRSKRKISRTSAPFSFETMQVHDPKIPYQDNSWDCGVFVCRYAYALYQQRNVPFTYKEVQCHPFFKRTITNSNGFRFDMSDIVRLREDMGLLIDRLSKFYMEFKEKEAEEKRKRKKERVEAD